MNKIIILVGLIVLFFGCVATTQQESPEATETGETTETPQEEPKQDEINVDPENQEALRAAIYQMNKNLTEQQEQAKDTFFENYPNAREENGELVFTFDLDKQQNK